MTCDDVAAAMTDLVGAPGGPVEDRLSLAGNPSWHPGPAQYMFQRAGGIACSTGTAEQGWQVTAVPNADAVLAGVSARLGYEERGESVWYDTGRCTAVLIGGDVLFEVNVESPGLGAGDTTRVDEAIRGLAARAAATRRDVELAESVLAGAPWDRFITTDELGARVGDGVVPFVAGGWGTESEVYSVVNGASLCFYTSSSEESEYNAQSYLTITTLPAGAWAFERMTGTPVEVEGADAALSSAGDRGTAVLDLRVGADWIRLFFPEGGVTAQSTVPIAEQIARNITVGRPAPR